MKHPIDSKLKLSDLFSLVLKGFCIGTANAVPGISGGTIAFLMGIYEDLIDSIKAFNLRFLRSLFQFKFENAFSSVPWMFLGSLSVGAITAIFSLSKILTWLLQNKPVLINSFFFGLILATIPVIARIIKQWTIFRIITVILSATGTFFMVNSVPLSTPDSWWFILLIGMIAISSMILPGISGSFMLLLLGKYQFILRAVNQKDIVVLGIFLLGAAMGLIIFIRILSWLFSKHHDTTIAVLTGFVIGSLNKIWPWKKILETLITECGKVIPIKQINFLPGHFTGEVAIAASLMAIGFIAALLLNRRKDADTTHE